MKKLFGEFLVEKGVVTDVELLEVLLQQMANLPTIAELVYRGQLLPSAVILKVLAYQSNHNVEFKKACTDLGFWSDAIEQEIVHEINKVKIPVGQLLVASGKVTFQKITMALDEYLADLEEKTPDSAPVKVPVLDTPVAAAVEPEEVPAPEAPMPTHSAAIEGYAEFLSDSRKVALKGLLANLTNDSANPMETLQLFHQGIHELKGMARFIRAEHSEKLLDEIESVVSVVQSQSGASKEQFISFAEKCGKAVDLLWQIKDGMNQAGSEEGCWPSVQEAFTGLAQELKDVSVFIVTGKSETMNEAA